MTDDLTTLLRDAGREPTVDLDVDAVHARGRRRTAVRRAAVGAGALALLGVLGVGVTNLLDAPDTPIVGPGPTATATPSVPVEGLTAAELAAAADLDVLRLTWDPRAFAGLEVERTAVAGEVTTQVWDAEPFSDPVVGPDGALWMLDTAGRTVRRDAASGATSVVATAATGTGWVPLAATEAGEVLVTAVPVDPDVERPQPSTVQVLAADGSLGDLAGIDVATRVGDGEFVGLAAWRPEHVAVTVVGASGSRVELLPAGGTAETVLELTSTTRVTALAFVGEELWVVELGDSDGTAQLHRFGPDGDLRATAPLDLGGPVAWPLAVGPAGEQVVVPVGPRSAVPVAHVLDVADVRAGATPAEAARPLAAPGLVHLLQPVTSPSGAPAACVDRPLNPTPGDDPTVWFLCWDAMDQLPDGAAHPFVAGDDRFAGADLAPGAAAIRAVLDAWAAGPTDAEVAAGLSGGLDPAIAEITGVRLDGTTVTVDLAGGPQVGVLSTSTGGATFVHAVVGAVLQFDGVGGLALDEVVVTLDGTCEAWGELSQFGGCPTYTEAQAPWSQGSSG